MSLSVIQGEWAIFEVQGPHCKLDDSTNGQWTDTRGGNLPVFRKDHQQFKYNFLNLRHDTILAYIMTFLKKVSFKSYHYLYEILVMFLYEFSM